MSPSPSARILVVDDELGLRELLLSELGGSGYEVAAAANGEEAVERFRFERFQLVISDVKMPRLGGLELLRELKRIDPEVEVIMSTGFGTVEMAVEAMKNGAYDFVQKPFHLDEIFALVEKALEKGELKALIGLYEASKAVFSSISLESLLPILVRLAARILRADAAELLLRGPDGALTAVAEWGAPRRPGAALSPEAAQRLARQAAEAGQPRIVPGWMAVPLAVEGEVVGVLGVGRCDARRLFTEADLRHATILGAHAAQAVRNAQLHAAVVQSEKLAAVGQLAAGVAHEINNPLTGIMGLSQLLLDGPELGAEQREDVCSIIRESQRCRDIVRGLLQFSRPRPRAREPVDIRSVLEATLSLVRYDFKAARLVLEADVPAGLPPVLGDACKLQQVFLNLVGNARHALEGRPGGVLRVDASGDGEKVVVRFSDNGPGIAPEDLARVFDPFFTTKPVGEGTGLGLSISRGIVAEHGGRLAVESAPGAGAAFTVELPAVRQGSAR